MNNGIENYRKNNFSIQQNYINPADLYKNMPLPVGRKPEKLDLPNQFTQESQSNQIYIKNFIQEQQNQTIPNQSNQQNIYNHQLRNNYNEKAVNINPLTLYNANNQPSPNQNILSQIDLLEKDINNIFTNNITPDRLERLGSRNISNGIQYDNGSLNPKHQMLGEYEKPTNLIHNNVTKNVVSEMLQEYTIIIDSNDRDIEKYPNPFSYRVKFNGLPESKDANIMKQFDNVKYIKLDTGIIPTKYYYVKQDTSLNSTDINIVLDLSKNQPNYTFNLSSTDVSGSFAIIDITSYKIYKWYNDISGIEYKDYNNTYQDISFYSFKSYNYFFRFAETKTYPNIVDTVYEFTDISTTTSRIQKIVRYKLQPYSLANEKYTLLYIDEFQNPNENSTNDIVGKSFSVMFPDGCNCDILYTSSGFIDKMFKFVLLGQINQMTINIKNSNGIDLKNSQENYIDKNVDPSKLCTCRTDTNGYFIRNYKCVCTYFRHPYYQNFQNTLIFRIGVIEPNIDKTIFS